MIWKSYLDRSSLENAMLKHIMGDAAAPLLREV